MRAVFQKGAVDAWVIWDPWLAEVEASSGARQVRNTEGLVPHYTFYLARRQFADNEPEVAKEALDELSNLSSWANQHQANAAAILSHSAGLDKRIWQTTLAQLPYGVERMTEQTFREQQKLADTFFRVMFAQRPGPRIKNSTDNSDRSRGCFRLKFLAISA
nr:putative aliphatic sulfonates-binding protein precursor [Candidatus Pantoea persica]